VSAAFAVPHGWTNVVGSNSAGEANRSRGPVRSPSAMNFVARLSVNVSVAPRQNPPAGGRPADDQTIAAIYAGRAIGSTREVSTRSSPAERFAMAKTHRSPVTLTRLCCVAAGAVESPRAGRRPRAEVWAGRKSRVAARNDHLLASPDPRRRGLVDHVVVQEREPKRARAGMSTNVTRSREMIAARGILSVCLSVLQSKLARWSS
jgi:hypothetical protein